VAPGVCNGLLLTLNLARGTYRAVTNGLPPASWRSPARRPRACDDREAERRVPPVMRNDERGAGGMRYPGQATRGRATQQAARSSADPPLLDVRGVRGPTDVDAADLDAVDVRKRDRHQLVRVGEMVLDSACRSRSSNPSTFW
jgi:hypothetical protein